MSKQAKGAAHREALRVFRRLIAGDAYLVKIEGTDPDRDTLWGLFTLGSGHRDAVTTVEGAIVRDWLARDWIEAERPGRMRISAAGAAWFRRALVSKSGGTEPFATQHRLTGSRVLRDEAGGPVRVAVNDAESPLGWLRRRKTQDGAPLISAAQFEAGERLRRDFTIAGLSPRVTANWDLAMGSRRRRAGPGGNAAIDIQDKALAARERLYGALEAVGPELTGVLVEVCCLTSGLEAAERSLGWPQRSGKIVLQLALTRLARHYGLISLPRPSRQAGRIRHWGADGFRPALSGSDDEPASEDEGKAGKTGAGY